MSKEIQALKKRLDEAEKVITFYATQDNWGKKVGISGNVVDTDLEPLSKGKYSGGKAARDYLEKHYSHAIVIGEVLPGEDIETLRRVFLSKLEE